MNMQEAMNTPEYQRAIVNAENNIVTIVGAGTDKKTGIKFFSTLTLANGNVHTVTLMHVNSENRLMCNCPASQRKCCQHRAVVMARYATLIADKDEVLVEKSEVKKIDTSEYLPLMDTQGPRIFR